jgi:cytochrome c oxidase assembly protein subunit 15
MLFQLAVTGLIVALLPLSMVWGSRDADKYRKLVSVLVFLTFDLIVFGAFTRLTDSGLGCPDWPGCYGHANPLQAGAHIDAAEALMPTGPVTVMKAWIEMIHRYLAMAIGVLIVSLCAISWRRHFKAAKSALQSSAQNSPWLPTLLVGFVCLQGAFGAWTVTMKLQPIIVTTHLLLGLGLLAMLTWMSGRVASHAPVAPAAQALRKPALAVAILLLVQLALGGWVSTNYAAVACTDFPLCQGSLVPNMDFAAGFALWRKLGMSADGSFLPFAALVAIHWVHRCFAFVVGAAMLWLAQRALKIDGLQRTSRWLLIILAMQFCTGLLTVFFHWPLPLAVAHNAGAAMLVLLLTMLNYKARLPANRAADLATNTAAGTVLKTS